MLNLTNALGAEWEQNPKSGGKLETRRAEAVYSSRLMAMVLEDVQPSHMGVMFRRRHIFDHVA